MENEINELGFSLDDLFEISEEQQAQLEKMVEDTFNDYHSGNHLLGYIELTHKIGFYRNKILTNFLISLINFAEQKYLKSKKDFYARQAFVVDSDIYLKCAKRIEAFQNDNRISTKFLLSHLDSILEQKKHYLDSLEQEIADFESKEDIEILEYFKTEKNASNIRSLINAFELYKKYLILARYI